MRQREGEKSAADGQRREASVPRLALEQTALWIYRLASLVATVEAFFLFIFGLDLTLAQIIVFVLFGFPAPMVMYALDRWLISRHVRPIQIALNASDAGQPTDPKIIVQGWIQALNLPTLTLLRVLTVHAPSVLVPLTALLCLANRVGGLGFAWWQFIILWLFWPITAVPHAIVEYFLIARATRPIVARFAPAVRLEASMLQPGATTWEIFRMALGMVLPEPQIIRTATGVQLAWLFTFVSLMPMVVLGTSVYLKITVRDVGVSGSLGGWIIALVTINVAVSVAIIALLSTRVHRAMRAFLGQMRRVQGGDLSGAWRPDSTDEFLDLGYGFNQMLAGLRDRETIKDTFGRFVSQAIAEAVLSGHLPLNGERREVSILFQDLRDFTSIAEQMDPDALVEVLNQFFTEMVAAVEAEGGVVKQFLGDGVMALFGAPVAVPDHAARAVRAAQDMVHRLVDLNVRLRAQGQPTLRIGVGIHTGEVVAGRIGPDTRVEYGVVGDPVNVASRIEGLTKQLHTSILISEVTAAQLGSGFLLGRSATLAVKGKKQPVQVVEVLGYEPALTPSGKTSLRTARQPEPGSSS
jgi:class 3 adenylate cyclase